MDPNSLPSAGSSFRSLTSSDLDSEHSTLSFFQDDSITLGTLMDYRPDPSPRRSLSSVHPEEQIAHIEIFPRRSRAPGTQRGWWDFVTCSSFKDGGPDGISSLGHFLQAERLSGGSEKVYINIMYEETEAFVPEPNPLFVESLLLQAGGGGGEARDRGASGRSHVLPTIHENSMAEKHDVDEDDEEGQNLKAELQRSCSPSSDSCAFHSCVSNLWGW